MGERETVAGMSAFVQAVESGSFSAAARRTGLTPSAVSKLVSRLEERLGARLLQRTTRQMTLTDAGAAFFERARTVLEDVRSLEHEITSKHEAARGLLRVTAPAVFGHVRLLPVIFAFQRRFPEITVDLDLTDRVVDLFADPVDVAIRATGEPPLSLVARKVEDDRRILCASPEYLKRHPAPRKPSELADHDCIVFTGRRADDEWRLRVHPDADELAPVRVRGRIRLSHTLALYEAALAGAGIADLPHYLVRDDLQAQRLVAVLEPFMGLQRAVYVLYVPSRFVAVRIREFVRYVIAALHRDGAGHGASPRARRPPPPPR